MRTSFYAGVAFAALILPSAAYAQSTASSEVEDEIVVTGSRESEGINGFVVPEGTKARAVITNELLIRQNPGQTVLAALNQVPGVNFTQSDPYGSSGGNIRIRGFDGNRISLTFDGFPLNDTGNYAIFSNQQLDPELVDQVNVNLGTTDVDSPTASAAGGTINYRTIIPREELGATLSASYGEDNYHRVFGMIETGNLTSFGTRAFAAASMARNDKFKGPGRIYKQQYNVGIYQPIGDNGDFIRVSGHYNRNRNNFYRNPGVGDLRTLLGTTVIAPANSFSATSPLVVGTNLTKAQENAVFGFENDPLCVRPTPGAGVQDENPICSNYYNLRINPSNTGNVRANSRFGITENLTFFADAAFQYVLANGGGTTALFENSARARGSSALPGVDFNGDGDFVDRIRFYTPNNTNTRRITATASLLYQFNDQHRVRIAYTFDRGRHRQTGEWGYLNAVGDPESVFGGRTARPVLNADGFQIGQRDRLSIALLHQVSGEYVGKFMDDRLTVQLGVRAPFFSRDLETFCPIQARDGFAYCTTEPIVAAGQPVPASGFYYVTQGQTFPASGGATPLYAPFAAKYKYSPILPSAGFNFRVNDDVNLFGSYAKGVSSPRTDNLYRAPIVDVNPEKTDAFDLGLRYTSPTIQGQVTAWYIKYANRIVTSFDADQGISVDRNVGSVNSYGVDAGLTVRPVQWLSLTGNASYTRAKLQDNVLLSGTGAAAIFAVTKGKQVVETPEWQFGGRAQVELGPVEIGFQGKYVGKRYATDVNDVVVPSYTMFDVDARFSLEDFGLKRTWFQLNVQNLFDEFYYGNISNQINASTVGCVNAAGTTVGCGTSSQPSFSVGYPRTVTASIRVGF